MKDIKYRTESAKDGNKTIIVDINGRDIPLHSKFNPLKEAEAGVIFPDPEKFDFLILLGCGLGYSYMNLKECAAEYRLIVVIDILDGIENEIAGNPYTSFLAERKNIRFISGLEISVLDAELSSLIDFDQLKGIHVMEHAPSVRAFSDYYDDVRSVIKRVIEKKAGDKATIRAFGNLFLRNALNNIDFINDCRPVTDLAGSFTGKKAVIVSSAPSIEDNLERLKFYEKHLYIIAVDSALSVLHCAGIKPDFVISIDPQPRIGEHFLGHDPSGVLHVFSIVSPPELVKKYKGYISLNSHPVSQVIDDLFPGVNGSIDSATGSVAGDAFLFALMAGFEFIAMSGFDFSFSDNIIYARETAYQNRYAHYFNNRFKTAETFNAAYIFKSSGSLVVDGKYTRRSFMGYRSSLDSLIKRKNCNNIYMINERGLPLANVQYADFDSYMSLPVSGTEEKGDFIRGLKSRNKPHAFSVEKIKERLLDQRVFDELIAESLGSEVWERKRKKIIEMIKFKI